MAIFDNEAINYDQWYESKLGEFVDKVETELAFSLFKPTSGMKILDVGCGTGNFSIKLAEMGCKVVGIDISEQMLNKARKKSKDKGLDIEFHSMDIYNINFPNESFDGVFSMAAFEFIKEPQKAYDEMYRVLKKNGNLLIGTINRDSKWGELYLSKPFQENSVFKYADFKSMDDLKSWNIKEVVDSGECLFIPPNIEEKDISIELEKQLSSSERGGFICALWKKEA
ncbi:class I SAM-dependent methyltransferase [Schnuerera sp.]|uniref:class I SAM-dependent methyltransferase n=1 Tax=Schnuerera sp. TaxID=2794844 RepID=UPI002CE6488B|nr:class I SAM-dependent methyltransferase [Schnuerera sp.]HSH36076.1 class I SAM-dependent methyltransferase [Schnuerera sp.]